MGWKSTMELTRKEAIMAIMTALQETPYDNMTNKELEDKMDELNIGDDINLPYYGYNFWIVDEKSN